MMAPLAEDLPLIAWYIGVLVFLEGLLSADNAIVLALMVRHLARHDRRRVLQWGIWGAIGFRVVAVFLSAVLLKFWFRAWFRGFWGTVALVTLTDIAFSIDSIVAAVGMADDFPARFGDRGKYFIVLTGGILGIITMRFVVRYFVLLLDRFPGLAEGAYCLVAWIGLKLTISGLFDAKFLGFHIPEVVFWPVMILIMILSFFIRPKGPTQERDDASEQLDDLGSEDESGEGQEAPTPPKPGGGGPAGSPRPR
jgi:predicted tellurium resistance membrane protein TerC